MLFGNVTEQDILLREELDTLEKENPTFKVFYILSHPPPNWKGLVGYPNKEVIQKVIAPPSDDSIVLVCGPPGMMKAVSGDKVSVKEQGPVEGVLKELGYNESQVYKF